MTSPYFRTELLSAAAPGAVGRAADLLRRGKLVAFPTDTVYGVGAVAWDEASVANIYVAKGRPPEKAIPLLIAGLREVVALAGALPPGVEELAAAFWPGALTLVVPKGPRIPDIVTGGGSTVAVRVPDHPVILQLLEVLREPLAATSANRSGQASPMTAQEVQEQLGGRINLILDGGPCREGVPSTVLDLTTSPVRILRAGPVSREALETALKTHCGGLRIAD